MKNAQAIAIYIGVNIKEGATPYFKSFTKTVRPTAK